MQIAGKIVPLGKGEYDSNETYNHLDWVRFDGCTWSCKKDGVIGVEPIEGDTWTLVSSKGSKGDTGASVDVTHEKDGKITTVTFVNAETQEVLDSIEIEDGSDGTGSGDMSAKVFATVEPSKGIVDKAIKLSDGSEEITIADVKSKITSPTNATDGNFLKYNGSEWVAEDASVDSISWWQVNGKPFDYISSDFTKEDYALKLSPEIHAKLFSIESKADKATTLSGYGITDAYIANGMIVLGRQFIQPATITDLSLKADWAMTLSGYGITDAYTKEEIDNIIGDVETLLASL